MKIAMAGECVADADAADAVSARVEQGRKDPNAELTRQDGDDAAGNPALGRHADRVDPFSGVIIHAAGAHHTEDAFHILTANGLLAGNGIYSAIGQRRGYYAEIMASDGDG